MRCIIIAFFQGASECNIFATRVASVTLLVRSVTLDVGQSAGNFSNEE